MVEKVVLITGGSRGLGRNAALHLAKKDIGIILTYLGNKEAAEAVKREVEELGGTVAILQLDIGAISSFAAFTARFQETLHQVWGRSRFDFLLNNAGMGLRKNFMETKEEDFDALMQVHVKGVFFLTQSLVPFMEDGGRIINVSSGLTRFTYPQYGAAYAIMKGAVEVMSRYMAKELGARNIAVNALAPGAIATDFGGGLVRDNPEVNQIVASMTAMGRAGLPDDIGTAVASMLMHDSQWMTGQRIEVSGGQSM